MQEEDLYVCGYQPDEDGKVKDLILGYYDDNDKLQCRGKVYLGVSESDRKIIGEFAKKSTVAKPWFRLAAVCASLFGLGCEMLYDS